MLRKLISFVLIVFLFCSCAPKPKSLDPNSKFGGILKTPHIGADPKTLNPWTADDASSANFGGILFEGLVRNNPDSNKLENHFASEFKVFDGGKRIRVTMRDDVTWSDGVPITVDDVVYTWNTLLRDRIATSSLRDILEIDGEFPEVYKVSDNQVEFKTKKVFAPFKEYIGIQIAPKHDIERYFKELGVENFEEKQKAFSNYLNINTEPEKIISSGPFKLKKIHHGERLEMERNPRYFIKNENGKNLPYLDGISYIYVQDNTASVFKFLADEVHSITVTAQNAALIKSLEKKYDFTMYDLGASTGTNFMWFNLSKNVQEPHYSWFNNRIFRRAISYAIDRDSVINNVFQGLGKPLFTAESLRSPYVNMEIAKGFKRDLKKSLALLESVGFQLKEEDGEKILYDKNQNRVEFSLFTNAGNPERELIAVIVVDNLKEIGIKANLKLLEFNNFVGRVMQGKDYQAGILSLTGGNEPNGGANVWSSKGRLHMFDVKATQDDPIIRTWEKEVDELFTKAVQFLDKEQRKPYYDKFQEIIARENPLIYVASPNTQSAVSNHIGGVRKTKYGGLMPYLYEVYIKRTNS